jgi:uncharacterized protein YndB with AHSA1/START domain
LAVIRKTFFIKAPALKVFDILTDHTKYSRWFDFIKQVTYPEGVRSGVGAKSHWITQIMGIKGDLDVEYKEWTPGKHVRVENVGPYFRNSEGSFTLAENPDGTTVEFEIRYEVPMSVFGQALDRLVISRELERGFDRGFARMKNALETQALSGSRLELMDYLWSSLGLKIDVKDQLSAGYVILLTEEPDAPADRFLLPILGTIARRGHAKVIVASTDLSRLSFEETIATPLGVDFGQGDLFFVGLTGIQDTYSNLSQDPSTLTAISLAISSSRKIAIDEGKVPFLVFHHLDPLIVKFGDTQVAKFLHEVAVRARETGAVECYVVTRGLCSDPAFASLVSAADAALYFQPNDSKEGLGALVKLVKARGVGYDRPTISLSVTDRMSYALAG